MWRNRQAQHGAEDFGHQIHRRQRPTFLRRGEFVHPIGRMFRRLRNRATRNPDSIGVVKQVSVGLLYLLKGADHGHPAVDPSSNHPRNYLNLKDLRTLTNYSAKLAKRRLTICGASQILPHMGHTQRKTLRQLVDEAKAAGKTQEEFAREHNLEPGQLSRLLSRKEPIGGRLAMRLQAITGIDAREFLTGVR